MSLSQRLALTILLVLFFFAASIAVYFWGNSQRDDTLDALLTASETQQQVSSFRRDMISFNRQAQTLSTLHSNGQVEQALQSANKLIELREATDEYINRFLKSRFAHEQMMPMITGSQQLSDSWYSLYLCIRQERSNCPTDTQVLSEQVTTVTFAADAILASATQEATRRSDEFRRLNQLTNQLTISVFLLTLCVTSLLGFFIIRYTNRSLSTLKLGTERIGEGDLNHRIAVFHEDEIGDLAKAFNRMADKLSSALDTMRASQLEAANANKAKSQFLANMSHELRTPLNTVIGYSEMIEEGLSIESEINIEEITEDIQRIRFAGKHLLALINDILDLSKVEAGKVNLHVETIDVPKLIDELARTMETLIRTNDNVLEIDVDDRVGEWRTDETKLRQILINLLSNAGKFTANGTIGIHASINDNYLMLKVRDSGIGMTQEQLDKIFDAFVQADSSTTKQFGGTGLGLAISHAFVELLNGSIVVQSSVDEGTTFTMMLPKLASENS